MVMNQQTLGNGVKVGEHMTVTLPEMPKVKGSYYLKYDWFKIGVIFTEGSTKFTYDSANYNLYSNYIEIYNKGNVYGVSQTLFYAFEGDGNTYYSLDGLTKSKVEGVGILLLEKDNFMLFRRDFVKIIEPNYDKALMMGNKNYTVKPANEYVVMYKNDPHTFSNKRDLRKLLKNIWDNSISKSDLPEMEDDELVSFFREKF